MNSEDGTIVIDGWRVHFVGEAVFIDNKLEVDEARSGGSPSPDLEVVKLNLDGSVAAM